MEIIEFVVELILGILEVGSEIADDLRNRNDRGKLKNPSDKYVC